MRRRHKPTDIRLAALPTTTSPEDRRYLVEQIGRGLRSFGHPRHHPRQLDQVLRAFSRLVRTDPSELVRYELAYNLAFWGERRAAWSLLPVLLDKNELPRVRGQAAEGLNLLQGRKLKPAQRARVLAALEAGLQDPEAEVRFWSIYAAGLLGLSELRPQIEKIRDTDGWLHPGLWYIRDEAADALAYLDTGDWPDRMPLPEAQQLEQEG